MMTPARIVRLVGIAALLGWLAMVSWMAKTTWAQNGAQAPQPPPALPAPAPSRVEQVPASTPPPIAPEAAKATVAEPSAAPANLPPPVIPGDAVASSLSTPADTRTVPPATPASEPAASPDDNPEKAAQSFVERNQKEAEEHLKALTAEADQLRTRLARLESGIKRWQVLVNALRSAQGVAAADEPSTLEPVPQTSPGGPRADKKVKWTSANPAPAPATATATEPQPLPAQPGAATEPPSDPAGAVPAPVARPAQPGAPGVVPR
jgi:hypothetical protein